MAKHVTYSQHAQALCDALWAVNRNIHFVIGTNPNDKEFIKRNLRFPPGTSEADKAKAFEVIDKFDVLWDKRKQ